VPEPSRLRAAVFLDRDGTICEEVGYLNHISRFRMFSFAAAALRRLNEAGKDITQSPITSQALADLLRKIESGEITGAIGKRVFAKMFETGKSAAEVIAVEGLSPISDAESVEKICREIIAKNAENVAKYRSGNEGVFKFFVGQVMRETRGRANPQEVNDILKRLLAQA